VHPGNRDAPYAYYLVSLGYYEQISDVTRDQKITQQALDSLGELMRRYPNSKYAADARLKVDLVRDHLAGKEMEIGRFYERRGLWLAANGRFRRVVDEYQTTTHVPEALMRLTETSLALGVPDEARKAARCELSGHAVVSARLQAVGRASPGSSRSDPDRTADRPVEQHTQHPDQVEGHRTRHAGGACHQRIADQPGQPQSGAVTPVPSARAHRARQDWAQRTIPERCWIG
jgi:hypothetical protein